MRFTTVILLTLLTSMTSCGKSNNKPTDKAPSGLVVKATVSEDGSGVVLFSATASNAVSYEYDFGNGSYQTVASGNVNYTYTLPGNNTYTVKVTATSAGGQTASASIQVTVDLSLKLYWSDEFSVNGQPDASKWGYDTGTGNNGWGNAEAQYYTNRPENVMVADGKLKITAIRENYNGSAYTSTRLLTKDKFDFKYGRIEVSAKLPTGGGTWPAIWMLGSNISSAGWPASGEIDIMEHKGNEPGKIYGTLHYPGHSGAGGEGSQVMIKDVSTTFHKYVAEWSPADIRFYVDGRLYYTFSNNSSTPFNQSFFVLLNFAMGGYFGGSIDPTFTSSTFEVDYVRVYK
ncbi:MAG TPA: family 16 glycosylhydrolase [Chitinophaga sp.]|uniref:family 16 glycosylhydrolase n=1 Tax=Chitinophaga sp. TaxID=1869181 RepID=UPI002C24EE50|nr:family 16 glycosylhydrolase [Chitinophaga sp.]HVI47069.1 family 16 glycosylhydrolase [Chitinophaga sp.]